MIEEIGRETKRTPKIAMRIIMTYEALEMQIREIPEEYFPDIEKFFGITTL